MNDDALTALIDQERNQAPVKCLEDVQARLASRDAIQQQVHHLGTYYHHLLERVRQLPALPPLQTIQWAQSVRAMPNVVFLEVDTTGLYEDAEIIRVVVLDKSSYPLLDERVHSKKPLSPQIERITGIASIELQKAKYDLEAVLSQVRSTLQGKYVLSYNLSFDAGKLRVATQRAHLPEITIIGEDLMVQAMSYFHLTSYPKLETLCRSISQPLPLQPAQTAIDRARGQIALLNAIADVVSTHTTKQTTQGTTANSDDSASGDDDLDDLDENPF